MSLCECQIKTFQTWFAMFWFDTQTKTKYILKTFRDEESLPDQKQSCISWKTGLEKWCFFILFVLMDAILLSLTLQRKTMYNFFFTFDTFFKHFCTTYQKFGDEFCDIDLFSICDLYYHYGKLWIPLPTYLMLKSMQKEFSTTDLQLTT